MLQVIFTILVGLVTMILFVLAVGLFGWVACELDKVPTPEWLRGIGAIALLIGILVLAYEIGRYVLGVL